MPIPRDSAFPSHSQAGDGPSTPRSEAEPKGARHARGLDGAAPVWPRTVRSTSTIKNISDTAA